MFELFEKLKQKGVNNKALAQLFIQLSSSSQLWDFIDSLNEEIIMDYWLSTNPRLHHLIIEEKIAGLKLLIEFKRYFSAIHICYRFFKEIPSPLIIKFFEAAATEKAN